MFPFNLFCSLGPQDEVKITLDCSQASFITSDKMVISLKGGEMWDLLFLWPYNWIGVNWSFDFECFLTECLVVCAVTCWRSSQMAWGACGRSTSIRLPPVSWPPVWVFSCVKSTQIILHSFRKHQTSILSACSQTLTRSFHLSPLRWWQWRRAICS